MDRVWFGTDLLARAARIGLAPAEGVFAGISGLRTLLYDAGWVKAEQAAIPVISIGNLTVGGTGKTPVAAWIARRLRDLGAMPAVILRGYGADEPLVHRELNPDVAVVTGADRLRAVSAAAAKGADIAILDDGFQHRQLKRDVDIVLISADRWPDEVRLLPAGPWREPLSAVRRAQLVIVTRKAASEEMVDRVNEAVSAAAPRVPRVSIHLAGDGLIRADGGAREPMSSLAGQKVTAVAAIGDPLAFVRQLESSGARVEPAIFRDHHEFTAAETERIALSAAGSERVVCTLKDAVKLRPHWPRMAPGLWYVSQRLDVERGVGGIERLLDLALPARRNSDSSNLFDPPDQPGSA
jgi:tetraacyldisaccharide 4'-kinase